MFTDFKNVWTPVLLSRVLRRNKPVVLQLAGTPVRVARGPEGIVAACEGAALPTHEGGGLVWLYTAPGLTRAPTPPEVPDALCGAGRFVFSLEVTWCTHWTRVLENMMDNAHLTFVHRRTLGRRLQRCRRRNSVLDVQCETRAPGFFITGVLDNALYSGLHHFLPPNGVVIYMDGPAGRRRAHIYCIPVHATATRLLIVSNFGVWNLVAHLFWPLNWYIVQEDRAIVESSHPAEVPPLGVEASVRTDKGTLRFRKYYYETLKEQAANRSRLDSPQVARS